MGKKKRKKKKKKGIEYDNTNKGQRRESKKWALKETDFNFDLTQSPFLIFLFQVIGPKPKPPCSFCIWP